MPPACLTRRTCFGRRLRRDAAHDPDVRDAFCPERCSLFPEMIGVGNGLSIIGVLSPEEVMREQDDEVGLKRRDRQRDYRADQQETDRVGLCDPSLADWLLDETIGQPSEHEAVSVTRQARKCRRNSRNTISSSGQTRVIVQGETPPNVMAHSARRPGGTTGPAPIAQVCR